MALDSNLSDYCIAGSSGVIPEHDSNAPDSNAPDSHADDNLGKSITYTSIHIFIFLFDPGIDNIQNANALWLQQYPDPYDSGKYFYF